MTPGELSNLRFGVLLNTSSGSCDPEAEKAVADILAGAGIRAARIWCGTGPDVPKALAEATSGELDVLVVVAGDGTIRAAAEACGAEGPILMPLPGGTMNMLPRTLYGDLKWRDALKECLGAPSLQWVHGGAVGDRRFFVAGIFGEPTRFAEAREAARDWDLIGAVGKGVEALRRSSGHELTYRFGESEGQAEAVVALCPLTSIELEDDDQVLEAAVIDVDGPLDAVRLAFHAAVDNWRNDRTVETARVKSFGLSSSRPIAALLDGETFAIDASVEVTFTPSAFRALRPAWAQNRSESDRTS